MKELAFLFKLGGGASSAAGGGSATPAATAAEQRSADVSPAAAAAAAEDAGLASIKQRLQQFQDSAAPAEQVADPAARQHEQQPPAAASPVPAPPPVAAAKDVAPAGGAGKPAPKPAASRLPAPPARASRLRPPTTSSGYFSNAATDSKCVTIIKAWPGTDLRPCLLHALPSVFASAGYVDCLTWLPLRLTLPGVQASGTAGDGSHAAHLCQRCQQPCRCTPRDSRKQQDRGTSSSQQLPCTSAS